MALPTTYQRVNTATDYDSDPTKFPRFLKADGIDDGMVTSTITPGTDKVQIVVGIRKLSNSSVVLIETSSNYNNNTGALILYTDDRVSAGECAVAGTSSTVSSSIYPQPITQVITSTIDRAGNTKESTFTSLQINSVDDRASYPVFSNSTGNYLAYPLYLFRRGGTSAPFNGHFYGGIIRFGDNLPIETIEQTERWMNSKTLAFDQLEYDNRITFTWDSATPSPDAV